LALPQTSEAGGSAEFERFRLLLAGHIKIQLISDDGEPIAGDLYAKVARPTPADYPGFAIDFTFVSTEIAAFFQRLLSPQPGLASAV
jgi:hypothetical protein